METYDAPCLGEDEERLVVWALAARMLAGRRRREAYTEAQLARKARLERKQAARFAERAAPSGNAREYLLRRELEALVERAGLTARQRELIAMAARGLSVAEMSRELGSPRSSVAGRLRTAYRMVRRARQRYPFAGLYEVYDEQTRR